MEEHSSQTMQSLTLPVTLLFYEKPDSVQHRLSQYGLSARSRHTAEQPLSILYFNARSALPKLDYLQAEAAAQNPCHLHWPSEGI